MKQQMTAQEMNIALENLRELSLEHQDRVLLTWLETNADEPAHDAAKESRFNRYISLRFVFLGAMWAEGDRIRAVKMAGTVTRDRNRMQKLQFSYGNLVRIKGGPRSNMVVTPDRLYPDEQAVTAGLDKDLQYGGQGFQFMAGRGGDEDFLYNLNAGMFRTAPVKVEQVLSPLFFIRAKDGSLLHARMNGNLVGVLKGMQQYRASLSLEENFRQCSDELYTEEFDDAEGWRLYPFSYCEGKGSIVMDADQIPHSFSMAKALFPYDDGLLQVQLPGNEQKGEHDIQRHIPRAAHDGGGGGGGHAGDGRLQAGEVAYADDRRQEVGSHHPGPRSGPHATRADRGWRPQRNPRDHWHNAGHLHDPGDIDEGGGAVVPGDDVRMGGDVPGGPRCDALHEAVHGEADEDSAGSPVHGHPADVQDIPSPPVDDARQDTDCEPVYGGEQSAFFPT